MKFYGGPFALNDSDLFIKSSNNAIPNVSLFSKNAEEIVYLERGTDSLSYIVLSILASQPKIKNIAFPLHYCEETIRLMFLKTNATLNLIRYTLYSDLKDIKDETIIIWNHFNTFCPIPVEMQNQQHFVLVEDFVHAPFDMIKSKSNYAFNSMRKVANCEVSICIVKEKQNQIIINDTLSNYFRYRKLAEYSKSLYINFSIENEPEYLKWYAHSESESNHDKGIFSATLSEKEKFFHFDFNAILNQRLKNHKALIETLVDIEDLKPINGHYMYFMINANNRDDLKSHLAKNRIYTAIHWQDSEDKKAIQNCLSIHIDQRYKAEDMYHIATCIREFYKNK